MALDKNALADKIATAIGAKDKDGNDVPATPEMKAYADAIITTYKAGLVSNLPGTINGVTAPGSPLVNGMGTGGLIAGLLPATMVGVMLTGFPTANPSIISTHCSSCVGYETSASLVSFTAGNITGQCTSTPLNPGPLVSGAGSMGKISGLVGAAWSSILTPPLGDPTLSEKIYSAIATYIMNNAEVSYLLNTVVGVCPPGGGPLAAGAGTGGTIA